MTLGISERRDHLYAKHGSRGRVWHGLGRDVREDLDVHRGGQRREAVEFRDRGLDFSGKLTGIDGRGYGHPRSLASRCPIWASLVAPVRSHDGARRSPGAINADQNSNLRPLEHVDGIGHRLFVREGRPVRSRSGRTQDIVDLEVVK